MPLTTPSDPQVAALLAHVLQQTQTNINFLASQNYITHAEASDLIGRLTQGGSQDSVVSSMKNLAIGPAHTPDPARRSVPPPPPRNTVQKARAQWAYNEDGREPNDLSFSAGEVIEIVDETNADWWTGKARGKQGLFPSNHVQKIDSSPSSAASPPPMPSMPSASSYYSAPPVPPQSYYSAPSYDNQKTGMYQPQYAPPALAPTPQPPVQQVVVQEEAPKKNKFGKLGNTMAQSAAGGVGFGAGAAIGSGIVNAIF